MQRRCRTRRLESCMGEEEGRSGNVFVVIRIPDGWLLQSRVFIFPGSYVGRFVIPWRSLVFHIALHPGLHISSVHPQFPNRFIYKLYSTPHPLFAVSFSVIISLSIVRRFRLCVLHICTCSTGECVFVCGGELILSLVISKGDHLP